MAQSLASLCGGPIFIRCRSVWEKVVLGQFFVRSYSVFVRSYSVFVRVIPLLSELFRFVRVIPLLSELFSYSVFVRVIPFLSELFRFCTSYSAFVRVIPLLSELFRCCPSYSAFVRVIPFCPSYSVLSAVTIIPPIINSHSFFSQVTHPFVLNIRYNIIWNTNTVRHNFVLY